MKDLDSHDIVHAVPLNQPKHRATAVHPWQTNLPKPRRLMDSTPLAITPLAINRATLLACQSTRPS
jgi:hypothetical protein